MQYEYIAIPESDVPRASHPIFQHLLDTYASETSKVITVWRQFSVEDMAFRPAERSYTVAEVMKHQLLSERRFFGGFIGLPAEPAPEALLPQELTPAAFCRRNEELCRYLRLLGKPVPPSYGPTADVTWTGADPTRSVEAAGR